MKNKLQTWNLLNIVIWGAPQAILRNALILLLLLCFSVISSSFGFYVMKYVIMSFETSTEARSAYVYAPPEDVWSVLSSYESSIDAIIDYNAFACYGSLNIETSSQEIRLANATSNSFIPLTHGRLPDDDHEYELILPVHFLDCNGENIRCESYLDKTLTITFANVVTGQPFSVDFHVVGLYDESRILTERNTIFAAVSTVEQCSNLQFDGYELPEGQFQPQAIVIARSRKQLFPLLQAMSQAELNADPLMMISFLELGGTFCATVLVFFTSFILLIKLALSTFGTLLMQGQRRMLWLVVLGQPFNAIRRLYFQHYMIMFCILVFVSFLLCQPIVQEIGPRLVNYQFPTYTWNPFALIQGSLLIIACMLGLHSYLHHTDCPWEILDDDSDEYV